MTNISPTFLVFAILFWTFFIAVIFIPNIIDNLRWAMTPEAKRIVEDALKKGFVNKHASYAMSSTYEVYSPKYRVHVKALVKTDGTVTYANAEKHRNHQQTTKKSKKIRKVIFEQVKQLEQQDFHRMNIIT